MPEPRFLRKVKAKNLSQEFRKKKVGTVFRAKIMSPGQIFWPGMKFQFENEETLSVSIGGSFYFGFIELLSIQCFKVRWQRST